MSASDPQHWLSLVHVSFSRWQPVAGWQTLTPVGPQGAHARLQQLPPHTPEAGVQSWPSTAPQFPPAIVPLHVPTPPPAGTVHWPLQQLEPNWQMSPV
jgi:hypothetical protein